jgi:hypothetical protein
MILLTKNYKTYFNEGGPSAEGERQMTLDEAFKARKEIMALSSDEFEARLRGGALSVVYIDEVYARLKTVYDSVYSIEQFPTSTADNGSFRDTIAQIEFLEIRDQLLTEFDRLASSNGGQWSNESIEFGKLVNKLYARFNTEILSTIDHCLCHALDFDDVFRTKDGRYSSEVQRQDFCYDLSRRRERTAEIHLKQQAAQNQEAS